tara:strand:+ start:2925 stop:3107 length:183 start_codon:yes stop_codon:yes gene_type:complete
MRVLNDDESINSNFRIKEISMMQLKESENEQIGNYKEWTEDLKNSFNFICGETKKIGYGI